METFLVVTTGGTGTGIQWVQTRDAANNHKSYLKKRYPTPTASSAKAEKS